jgi:hypothetical protein
MASAIEQPKVSYRLEDMRKSHLLIILIVSFFDLPPWKTHVSDNPKLSASSL